MASYRILVVDDSVFMRKIVSDLIAANPQFEVVGTAKNGIEAIEKVKLLQPDAVTMDIEMPEMNGLDTLKQLMIEQPTPVIMLSSLTQEGTVETIQALEWGAVDFIGKPSGSISLDLYKVKCELHEKLQIAVNSNVRAVRPKFPPSPESVEREVIKRVFQFNKQQQDYPHEFEHIVAIGTSTGGPRALNQVLSQIPASFPAPILIVQHMPPNFTKSLARRLDDLSKIRVVEAEDGEMIRAGTAYIAPGGWHMTAYKETAKVFRIRLTKDEPRSGHCPSVDILFESLLSLKELKRHAVIMTGMGSDGAKGILALRQNGALTTIAEAEQTCVVYGMPRAAVELNSITHILPQQEIANKLIQCMLT